MKKLILTLCLLGNLFASEPLFYGAFYGDMKDPIKEFNNYPDHAVSSAGNVYLYNNNIKDIDFIYDKKSGHITAAIEKAKKYAKKKNFKKCAVDNIKHQVIKTESAVIIMTDYNVIGFN